jgi:hypothetical protein
VSLDRLAIYNVRSRLSGSVLELRGDLGVAVIRPYEPPRHPVPHAGLLPQLQVPQRL